MSVDEYKELKLTIHEAMELIQNFVEDQNGRLSTKVSGTQHNITVVIPGAPTATLALYDTKKGLTIHPKLGANIELSCSIAKCIVSNTEKVTNFNQRYSGIHSQLFEEFESFILDNGCNIDKTTPAKHEVMLKVTRERCELTIHWYPGTNGLLVQGRTSNLMDDLVLWLVDHTASGPKEVIDLLFESFDSIRKQKIIFPEDLIETELQRRIGTAYSNPRLVTDYEKKWLKTSLFLCNLDIQLPEYYPAISSSIKVVEGLLRRLCIFKFGVSSFTDGSKFTQFCGTGEAYNLRPEFRMAIREPSELLCLESIYTFIATKRHCYQHNNGINPALVTTKEIANSIFDEVITLIIDVEMHNNLLT